MSEDEIYKMLDEHYQKLNEIWAEEDYVPGNDRTDPADQEFIDWVNGLTD